MHDCLPKTTCATVRRRPRVNLLASEMARTARTAGAFLVRIAAWAWALVAGVGGLALLIHEGPLPITNGWFAMFSGIAACPLTAALLEKGARIKVRGYIQFAVAFLIFSAGR